MKLKSSTKYTLVAIFVVVFVLPMAYWAYAIRQPAKYDTFTQCIADKGVIFYGAFWCPNCQDQKRLFGRSEKLLPYVECSTSDRRGQLQVCVDEKIEAYPTWVFPNGERLTGVLTREDLSQRTECPLP